MSPPLLAVIGDVHSALARLEVVLDHADQEGADGLLLVGDLACAGFGGRRPGYRDEALRVLSRVARRGLPFAYVPGNHDLPDLGKDTDFAAQNADGRVLELCGLRILGVGGAGPARFGFAYEWTDEALATQAWPPADVLLSHTPPFGTLLDRTVRNEHVGSHTVRARALLHPGVLVCGHIHEAPGVARLGSCLCLNAGGLGQPFGQAQIGFLRGLDQVWVTDLERGSTQSLERAA